MYIHYEINKDLARFTVIYKEHSIKALYTFGSSVTDLFNLKESDIDYWLKWRIKYLSDVLNAI